MVRLFFMIGLFLWLGKLNDWIGYQCYCAIYCAGWCPAISKSNVANESLSAESQGFITLISVVELVWIMQGCYKATKDEWVTILQKLIHTREIFLENAEVVVMVTRQYSSSSADFANCIIERSANYTKCTSTMTFDSKAAKSAGMQLIQ